jgi:hypothetical protein
MESEPNQTVNGILEKIKSESEKFDKESITIHRKHQYSTIATIILGVIQNREG